MLKQAPYKTLLSLKCLSETKSNSMTQVRNYDVIHKMLQILQNDHNVK